MEPLVVAFPFVLLTVMKINEIWRTHVHRRWGLEGTRTRGEH